MRTYSELIQIPTHLERFRYLKLQGEVGKDTFGFDRYLNQIFYHSKEWRHIRDLVIVRDSGCDLAVPGYEIHGRVYIHHMNPVIVRDILDISGFLINPEYLICVTFDTHNAIHYGSEQSLRTIPQERFPNDTCPWRK